MATSFFSAVTHTPSEQLQSEGVSIAYRAYADETAGGTGNTVCFYVVNVGRKGFVMLSGDDRFKPILGYSNESSFSTKNMPESLRSWLEARRKEISSALGSGTLFPSPEIIQQWNHLSEIGATVSVMVQPLLQTTWDQDAYYNQFCPADPSGPNGHAYAGCVATAMAQIIRYWQWPWSGFNSHSYTCDYGTLSVDYSSANYNYNNMPGSIQGNSSSTQIDAVATLTYHCGVSVNMDYSPNGSGASSANVPYALVHYFAYPPYMSRRLKSNYSSAEWNILLRSELDNGRPILYSGEGSGGHSFVCDGYDNNGSYHFNWGWSGFYNGYFALNALTPASSHNYTEEQEAIVGITAAGSFIRCSQNSLTMNVPMGGAGEVKTVVVRGHSLSGNISVTAGNGFTVGTSANSFSSSVTMPAQGGTLYVKYTPTLSSPGNQNANVILSSGSVHDTVFCYGTVFETVCLPPQDLSAFHTGSQVNLSWSEPVNYGNSPENVTLSWDSTVMGVSATMGSDLTLCMMQRFDMNDLAPYHHYLLNSISFIPSAQGTSFRLVAYKGGNYSNGYHPGTQVVNQEIPTASLVRGTWNTVQLNSPVLVDATEELWFGFVVYTTGNQGKVILLSAGSHVPGKGNVLGVINGYNDGTGNFYWDPVTLNYNFPIKGMLEQISADVVRYDVYRNASQIGSSTSTAYIDNNPLASDCEYTVTAVWGNNCSQSASVTVNPPAVSLPTVTTGNVSNIMTSTATCDGEVTSAGGSTVTARGVCWSTSPNPTVSGNHTSNGSGTGTFTGNITGLTPNTTYYVRAYATNNTGTAYGVQKSFKTSCNSVTVSITGNSSVSHGQSATLTASGASTYHWNTNENTASITVSPTSTTTYTVTGTNSYGCTATANKTVTVNADLPTVTTIEIFNITTITAVCGSEVTSDGGATVTTRGVCWSTSPNPTTNGNHTTDGSGTGSFTSFISGLTPNTTYHVRAYATSSMGTAYGEMLSFTTAEVSSDGQPCPNHPTVTDIDGNVYNTVQVGDQCWMKENMRTTRYANGTAIALGSGTSETTAYRYHPNNNSGNVTTYGYLYNWAAVMHGASATDSIPSGVQGICPAGWHVPSIWEWSQLTFFIRSQDQYFCSNNSLYFAKSLASTTGWNASSVECGVGNNPSTNNATNFSVLAAGYYYGGASDFGNYTYLWSTSESEDNNVYSYGFCNDQAFAAMISNTYKTLGLSVRCLRDEGNTSSLPAIITHQVASITSNSATCGGDITDDGGAMVTARGVCWSTSPNPTVNDSHTTNGSGTGTFSSEITGLSPNTTYYVRAYATNSEGTAYGEEVSFTTNSCFSIKIQPIVMNGQTEPYCPTYGNLTLAAVDATTGNPIPNLTYSWFGESVNYLSDSARTWLTIVPVWCDTLYIPTVTASDNHGCISTVTDTIEVKSFGPQFINTIPDTIVEKMPGCVFKVPDFHDLIDANLVMDDCYIFSQLKYSDVFGTIERTDWYTQVPAAGTVFTDDSVVVVITISNPCGKSNSITVNVLRPASIPDTAVVIDSKSCPAAPTVTDIDGNVYSTVQIGGQCWMRQNLRVTHYADGTAIPAGGADTSIVFPYYYDNSSSNIPLSVRGYFYNWPAATHGSGNPCGVQGVCPQGWHVPNDEEWTELASFMSQQPQYTCGGDISNIGKALASNTGWETTTDYCAIGNDQGLNNATGFCAYPTGGYIESFFFNEGNDAIFWTSVEEEYNQEFAKARILSFDYASYHSSGLVWGTAAKDIGLPVRCLRNSTVFIDTVPPVFHGMLPDGHVCPSGERYYIPDFTTYFTEETVSDNNYPFSSLTVAQSPVAGTEIDADTEVTVSLTDPCGNVRLYPVEVVRLYLSGVMIDSVVCESGLPVFWNGKTLEGTGTYYDTLTNVMGCDSIVVMNLYVLPTTYGDTIAMTCESFDWYGETFTSSGEYTHTYTNSNGCDSVVTLHLTVNYADTVYWYETACNSYTWNGITYYESGTYVQYFSNVNYCDSIVTLHLTVIYPDTVMVSTTVCESFDWYGETFTSSGEYTHTYTNFNGCDSVVTLHLTVNYADTVYWYETACNSYTWNGITYYESGTYVQYFSNVNYCDSIVTLHLTVIYPDTVMVSTTVCENELPFTWNGVTFTEAGTQTLALVSAEGCDSVVVMTLHVANSQTLATPQISVDNAAICNGGQVTLTVSNPDNNAVYTWFRNGAVIPGAVNATIIENPTTTDGDPTNYVYTVKAEILASACTSSSQISPNAVVTVIPNPVVSVSVDGYTTLCEGGSTSLNTNVTPANGNYSYQWYKDNVLIGSAVSDHYVVSEAVRETAYSYSVVVSGLPGCTVTAQAPAITFVPDPYITITASNNVSCVGGSATLTAEVTCDVANANFTYYWYRYGTNDPSNPLSSSELIGTSAELTIPGSEPVGNYAYWMIAAADAFGCRSTSNIVNYAVVPDPAVTIAVANGYPQTVCSGGESMIKANVMGGFGEISYQWYKNGNLLVGETNQTLALNNLVSGMNHLYAVEVSQTGAGCSTSASAALNTLVTVESFENSVFSTACDSYTWNDTIYYESGIYTQQFQTVHGCDSVVTLHLTVHHSVDNLLEVAVLENDLPYYFNGHPYFATGIYIDTLLTVNGCDSIVALHLTVLNNVIAVCNDTICESELPFVWNDSIFTEASTKTAVFAASTGADSIVVMNLYVLPTTYGDTIAVACDSFEWYGETFTNSGVYTHTFSNANGCDSVVTLHLTVNHSVTTDLYATACDSYTWNGTTYTESGDYPVYLTNALGCDSIVTLHLTINYSDTIDFSATACNSYNWNGVTYTQSGDYTTYMTNAAGCNLVLVLHLTVNHSDTTDLYATACDSYFWNGTTYHASGDYVHVFTNTAGCDSVVTLHLTLKHSETTEYTEMACDSYIWNGTTYTQSGDYVQTFTNTEGCDSVVTLHLTINHSVSELVEATVCDSYTWNGEVYSESGAYTQTLTNVNGCDSVVTLHLMVNHSCSTNLQATACDSYTWNGTTYTESGDYPLYLTNALGCDSVVTLHLTVNHSDTIEFSAAACNSYNWNGVTYTQSGDYTTYMTNAAGCNLVLVLHLTVNHSDTTDLYAAACDSYTWNGETYTVNGNYTIHSVNETGCDSTVTLHLTINHPDAVDLYENACDSYFWNGVTYSESGDYTSYLTNVNGCDSTVTLHLTIHQSNALDLFVTACENYTWNGETYTESGNYTLNLNNAAGCDSIVTLHLTVNHPDTVEFFATACDSYNWNEETYTESGDYTHLMNSSTGCNLVAILHLTINQSEITELNISTEDSCYVWNGTTYCNSGDYIQTLQTVDGCDSLVILHLTITVGIDDHELTSSMVLYPNPTDNIVNVKFSVNGNPVISEAEIQIFDMYGKFLHTVPVTGETTTLDLSSFASGIYFVKAVVNGQVMSVRKAVRK